MVDFNGFDRAVNPRVFVIEFEQCEKPMGGVISIDKRRNS